VKGALKRGDKKRRPKLIGGYVEVFRPEERGMPEGRKWLEDIHGL